MLSSELSYRVILTAVPSRRALLETLLLASVEQPQRKSVKTVKKYDKYLSLLRQKVI